MRDAATVPYASDATGLYFSNLSMSQREVTVLNLVFGHRASFTIDDDTPDLA